MKFLQSTDGKYEHPGTLIPRLAAPFGPFDSLLDVGGGGGTVGRGVWPVQRINVLDIFPPKTPPPNFTLGSALDADKIFGPKSFDVVQACEIIEHIPKEAGALLITVLEQIARKLVILTTPWGFAQQDPELAPDEPWANNPHQKHLCGWLPEEFANLGYTVYLNPGGPGSQLVAWKVMEDPRTT